MTETISRRRSFAQVPDDLVIDKRLSHLAVRLWVRLDKYAGKDGDAFPSRARLADDLGVSKGGIARALAELAHAGWITRRPRTAGGVWNTELNDQPRQDPDSHLSRPQPTSESAPTQIRVAEGDPTKDTKERAGESRVAASLRRDEAQQPRSDWRGNDRQLWADTIGARRLTSDGSGPWNEGTWTTAAFYDAFRKGSANLKAKRWPGIFLSEMDDWEDYLSGLGLEVVPDRQHARGRA